MKVTCAAVVFAEVSACPVVPANNISVTPTKKTLPITIALSSLNDFTRKLNFSYEQTIYTSIPEIRAYTISPYNNYVTE